MAIVFSLGLVVPAGCARSRPPQIPNETVAGRNDEGDPGTARLAWRDYEGDPRSAEYFLGSQRLGTGGAGLDRVLDEVARLPEGTQLLIVGDLRKDELGGFPIYEPPPYADRVAELRRRAAARRVRVEEPTRQPGVVELGWRGYDSYRLHNPDNAVYVFAGRELGRGRRGFEQVIRSIRSLPRDSLVVVQDPNWSNLGGLPFYAPPYGRYDAELVRAVKAAGVGLQEPRTSSWPARWIPPPAVR
jgi:hypothetical protein